MIKILENINDISNFNKDHNSSIGFVPTMGNLHAGHLSLIRRSLKENQTTVVSIFVNPKQFGEKSDLDNYPRTFEEDKKQIEKETLNYSDKNVYIFYPKSESIIYPKDFKDYVSIEELNSISEGKTRPGHFDGVATVVKRLFKLIKPSTAYFGKKDYQQYLLVKKMVLKENLNILITGMPIIRENDGLAMSSRNSNLDSTQRKDSLVLSKTLLEILFLLQTSGLSKARDFLKTKLNTDKRFNYLEIRNAINFDQASDDTNHFVILGNLQLGETRLLDNVEVTI